MAALPKHAPAHTHARTYVRAPSPILGPRALQAVWFLGDTERGPAAG